MFNQLLRTNRAKNILFGFDISMRVQVVTNSIYPYQINNNHRIEQNKNVSFVGRIGSLNHGLSKFDLKMDIIF